MVYEELKALTAGAGEYAKDTGRSSLSAGQISVIGAASKLAASVVTYPSQVQLPHESRACTLPPKIFFCGYSSCATCCIKLSLKSNAFTAS